MNNFIVFIGVIILGYGLAVLVQKVQLRFKFSTRLISRQCNISLNRVNNILLQENHGRDIDSVVDNVKKSNPSLQFTLKYSEIKKDES